MAVLDNPKSTAEVKRADGARRLVDKKMEAMRAHPAAEAYRLMTEDELAELVASIKANGLRDLITVGIVGQERWIIDGRNRLKACEIAGVPPEYEEAEFANEDELRTFVADRNERRNITSGQKAMAHAMLFPEAKKTGRGNKVSGKPETLSTGHWQNLVSQARAVLAYSPALAEAVRDGTVPLAEAFQQAEEARQAQTSAETMRAVLQAEAPELLEMVDEGRMKLPEARAALKERQAEIERHKKVATLNVANLVRILNPHGADPQQWAERIFGNAEPRFWPAEISSPLNHATLDACAKVAAALAEKWRE